MTGARLAMSAPTRSRRTAYAYLDLTGLSPFDAAGLRQVTLARSTGTVVGVYDAREAGLEGSGFATVCENHSRLVIHDTLTLARRHASCPEGWCGVCNGSEQD